MTSEFEVRLKAVDPTTLTSLVCRALKNETVEVVEWGYQRVTGGLAQALGHSYGIYRLSGKARIQDKTVSWSLILKAMGGPSLPGSEMPSHWAYWKREALAYQSGLLDNLRGGLVAPHCFGVVEYPGEEFWIWLEDIPEDPEKVWSLERYGLAARHLGQFNGAYFVGQPLPEQAWLSQGRIRAWLDFSEPFLRDLRHLSQHPLARRWLSDDSVERILRLWAEREMFLEALDRLPRCLCHHDAFRRNLMARVNSEGQDQTVAIDWALVGTGVIGEEIATLVGVSLSFLEVEMSQAKEFEAIVFAGYLKGLQEADWHGDARLVRFGFAASVALYQSVGAVGPFLHILKDGGKTLESVMGYPIDYILDRFALLQRYRLDLGDEARTLIDAVG